MRTFILASALALVAAPAFAQSDAPVTVLPAPTGSDNPTATATFELFVKEDCTFDKTDTTQELVLRDNGNGIQNVLIDVKVECNTPFKMTAVDGIANGAENEVSMARAEIDRSTIDSQYKETFKGDVVVDTAAEKNNAGRYPSQDVNFGYKITWEKGGTGNKTNGYAAGNYEGSVVFMLTGRDVARTL